MPMCEGLLVQYVTEIKERLALKSQNSQPGWEIICIYRGVIPATCNTSLHGSTKHERIITALSGKFL